MNPQTLSAFMHHLTEHEKLYKSGQAPNLPDYPYIEKDGKMIMKSLFSTSTDVLSSSPYITVKRHSRFQTYPLHYHDWVEINYMYDGSCKQIINNQVYSLEKGQVLLIDSDTIHTIEPLGESDILINIIINKDYFNSNFFNRIASDKILSRFFINSITDGTSHDSFILFHSENSRRLPFFMDEFFCEWYSPSTVSLEMLNNLLSLIIIELINVYEDDLSKNNDLLKKNSIIPVLRYIETNYQKCSLKSTADFFKMNGNYLSSQLKKYTGMTFIELLHQEKIRSAKILLKNSELSISDISHYIGYENISFFYKKFKSICGCLPGDYRKQT